MVFMVVFKGEFIFVNITTVVISRRREWKNRGGLVNCRHKKPGSQAGYVDLLFYYQMVEDQNMRPMISKSSRSASSSGYSELL